MSTNLASRPSRRAAVKRNVIVEDSDDDGAPKDVKMEEDEDDFTPAMIQSPKRKSRRRATEMPQTPRSAAKTRRARTGDGLVPAETLEAEADDDAFASPTKSGSPRKRKSTAPARRGRPPATKKTSTQLPTPQASATPEPFDDSKLPLSDITNTVNNEPLPQNTSHSKTITSLKSADTVLEKPMDIVIRSRAIATPAAEEDTAPKPRTVIKSLVLMNFKSYAGRQEVGPFHASFSSVVGPNGSGKSNVIDSLLFVFGFRASKMRQGKISALIHNSAAFPDLEYCEVEVHFQEVMDLQGGGHEVIPGSDLIISRKAFKSNASKYYINARESNFTDVTTLLKGKGVDLDHKRFLILQGEVESIAQMKPKAATEHDDGLLEYLEDIIGTSKYKVPIEESAAEVDTLNEVCLEKSSRVQHVEKEKNGLEDKKNKVLDFIKNENELVAKQSALYQVYTVECEDNLKVTDEAIAETSAELDAESERHRGNEDGILSLEKSHKRGLKELEALQKATQAVLKEMAKYDKENVKHEEKKKFLKSKKTKQEKSLQTARLAASEAKSLVEKHTDDLERNTKEIASLEQEMSTEEVELSTIRDSLKGKTQAFSDQIAAKQKKLEPWTQKINAKQSSITLAQSELDMLRERASSGTVAIEETQARLSTLESDIKSKREELKHLEESKSQIQKDALRVDKDLAKLTDLEPEIRNRLSGVRQKADEAKASLSSTQNQGNVLNGLMRLQESGRIDGFHGRLGNLGTIDPKYDVAISTACPSLENLVVNTVEVGQQCIDYLRKNNLGRANIILLDRLAKRDLSKIDTPENAPRLFDLVKAKDEKYRPAFFSVLQNTLVADDLEQANRIAYGARRWRVVTLDGQLIDVSGTMSGGGNRVAKGAMSSKLVASTSKEQVSKLEVDRDQIEKEFEDHQQKMREAETRSRSLRDQIPKLEMDIQKVSLGIESVRKNQADTKQRIVELKNEENTSGSDESQIAELENQIAGLEKEIQKLHSETAGLEGEIQSLHDKIMEVGGVKLRAQKAKVDGLKEQIDLLTEEMSNAEIAISKAKKQVSKQEKAFEEAQKELASADRDLEGLDSEAQDQTNNAATSKQRAEAAQDELSAKKDELASLKKELDDKTTELNETRAVEIEMRNKLEENQKIQSENHKRLKYWNEKLSKLAIQSTSDLGEEEQTPEELPQFTRDELEDLNKDVLKAEIATLEERLQNVNVELGVLAEYRRRVEEHASRNSDLQTALAARDAAKKRCDELRRLRLEGFMTGFSTISLRLKEMYQMITMGGNAELELVDSLDPFSEGILFSVMPPKKSWKNISNLSGGEKTLSSLALVFALHHYKPTPLYVMDEIDAALDFRNVSIVASYIKERTKNAQFIVISLRNNMFELASRLVGVYKVNHMTKSVTVENRDYISRR